MPPLPARGHRDQTAQRTDRDRDRRSDRPAAHDTCEAVVRACLDRIAAREAEVHAWAHLDPDAALAAARAPSTSSGKRGPLAGVPFGVKDIIDTFDMPTEWGTPIHKGRQPERDAACVALSRKAGGVLLGKTVTTEFANLHPGPTRNPHDLTRTPAGSSSGSAAAVADFMVPIAIGTQTTGSTIRPASFCGVFGYRPTYGEHRMHGVMEASGSLDTLGILARSVADIALYRDVLLGIPPEPMPNDRARRTSRCAAATSGISSSRSPARWSRTRPSGWRAPAPASPSSPCPPNSSCSTTRTARSRASSSPAPSPSRSRTTGTRSATRLRGGRLHDGLDRQLRALHRGQAARRRMPAAARRADGRHRRAADARGVRRSAGRHAGLRRRAAVSRSGPRCTCRRISIPVFKGPAGMPIGAQLIAKRHDDRKLFACAQWAFEKLT